MGAHFVVFTYDQVEIVDAVEVLDFRASSTAAGGVGESHSPLHQGSPGLPSHYITLPLGLPASKPPGR